MTNDLGCQTFYPIHTFCIKVEYLSSSIFEHYSRVEWLRNNKVVGSELKSFAVRYQTIQYGHIIPALVGWTSVSAWLGKHDNMSLKKKNINDPGSLQIKATFSCEVIHASMPKKLSGNRACGRAVCPGCQSI